MATTNFLQVNPSAANQETDTQFAADSLTTGGIGVDDTLPSKWLNKAWYQSSTFIAALAQALAAKGYSTSDANLNTLAGVLGNIITNNDLKSGISNVGYSANITFDASRTNGFFVTLGGNVASSVLTNSAPGQILTFVIRTNGYSFAWPANLNLTIPVSGNSTFVQQFIVLTDGSIWSVTGLLQSIVTANTAAIAALQTAVTNLTPIANRTAFGGGFYRISADGTIEVWGTALLPATNNNQSNVAFNFPIPFNTFTTPPILTAVAAGRPQASPDSAAIHVENVTINGASIFGTTVVPEGGGVVVFNQAVPVNFYAIGK